MRLRVIQLIGMLFKHCQIETVVLLLLIHYLFLVPLLCGFSCFDSHFIYSNFKSRVKFDNRASSEFTCYLWIRQGEGVATTLFSMY